MDRKHFIKSIASASTFLGLPLGANASLQEINSLLIKERGNGSMIGFRTDPIEKVRVGIIGLGHIGKEIVRLIKPFGCNILANDIVDQDDFFIENDIKKASKQEIFKTCDFVTINTPHNDTTNNMVDINVLKIMKNSAYILNIARGGIINEGDLKYALKNNIIAGAAIDAYSEEPPSDKEFLELPNLICTPHIGGNAKEAVEAMGMSAIKHLREFYKL